MIRIGTIFTNTSVDSAANISTKLDMFSNLTPAQKSHVVDTILELYPNVPALGCPFGTGNDTFGLNPEFKRFAAIQTDVLFAALRRNVSMVTSANDVPVFSYLFTDPQPLVLQPFDGSKLACGSLN